MKKSLLSLCALVSFATMLTSCTDEQQLAPAADGNVTFSVTVPGTISSRAFADGTTAQNNVVYYVYDAANGNDAAPVLSGNVSMSNLKGTVTLGLATNHSYDVVFLATSTDAPYTYNETSRNLSITYTGIANNDENLDAFYDVLSFTVTSAQSYQAQLTRPFAQLNIGTKDLVDYESVTGKKVANTSVTISQLYSSINLMDGTPAESVENVCFTTAAIPNGETFPVSYTPADGTTAVPYTYLAMDYLLVPETKDIVEVTMTVEDAEGNVLETKEYSNIPVQRNYRTNIYGALLTTQQEFNVEILPGFAGADYNIGVGIIEPQKDASGTYLMTNEGELAWLAQQVNGGNRMSGVNFSLQNDIYLTDKWTPIGGGGLGFESRFCGKFLGNNHTIYNMEVDATERAGFFGFFNGTVEDLNFDNAHVSSNHWAGVVAGYSDNETGSTYIKNCKVTNSSVTLAAEEVKGEWDNGDKGGMIIGFMASLDQVTNCSATNCILQGYRDLGGIIGYASGSVITGNTVDGLTIYVDNSHNYKNYTILGTGGNDANGVIGEKTSKAVDQNNTSTGVTVVGLVADGVTIDDEGNYLISKPSGMVWMAQQVNDQINRFSGKTVKLTADLDMTGVEYTPCGFLKWYPTTGFAGTFDGQGHTISNLTTSDFQADNASAGLFGAVTGTIQNVNMVDVNISSSHYAGAICGYTSGGTNIKDCTVSGGKITSTPEFLNGAWDNGDKVGGIIGYASGGGNDLTTISGCTVENLTIQAYRDFGGIVGTISAAPAVLNNTVKDVTLLIDNTHNYKGYTEQSQYFAGEVIGHIYTGTSEGNTASGVTISYAE